MDDNQEELRRLVAEVAELKVKLDRLERQLNVVSHIASNVSLGLIRRIPATLTIAEGYTTAE